VKKKEPNEGKSEVRMKHATILWGGRGGGISHKKIVPSEIVDKERRGKLFQSGLGKVRQNCPDCLVGGPGRKRQKPT